MIKKEMFMYIKNTTQTTWTQALKCGCDLLQDNNYISATFYDSLVAQTKKLGPYYILLPNLALAYTEIGPYNLKTGLSLVVFENAVQFTDDGKHNVKFLFTLSTTSPDDHIEILKQFANNTFGNKAIMQKMYDVTTYEDFMNIYQNA